MIVLSLGGTMRCFEMIAVESYISSNGGPFVPDNQVMYTIPEEACDLLKPNMALYQQSPHWFFDMVNYGRPPAQWTFACFDSEYPIAGQIAMARENVADVGIVPYSTPPNPIPQDFVPMVGALSFASASSLRGVADISPILSCIWSELSNRDTERRWLVLMDPLPNEWILKDDETLWRQQWIK